MSSFLAFETLPEAEVLNFKQRAGENLKKAWDRLSEAHKRIMPWIPMKIVLSNFYHGVFRWCKHSLDILAEGDFIECGEEKALDIIDGLSSFFVYDYGVDAIIDRLDSIEEKIVALDMREVEKPKPIIEEILEIEDDWEPFIRISILNQDFLAYCDIRSMVSTMPKTIYNSLKLVSMVDLPCYHEHANGDISEIQGKVDNIQV